MTGSRSLLLQPKIKLVNDYVSFLLVLRLHYHEIHNFILSFWTFFSYFCSPLKSYRTILKLIVPKVLGKTFTYSQLKPNEQTIRFQGIAHIFLDSTFGGSTNLLKFYGIVSSIKNAFYSVMSIEWRYLVHWADS